jgi:HAD superfamily hydrolase (TIGR01549 family)
VDTLDYLRSATGAESARIHKLLMKFEEDGVANARLNRWARTLLRFLARRQIPTALLTRNSRKSVAGVCRKLRLQFDVTVAREDGPHKPAPEPIWQIARRWRLRRRELLLVGDYKWDVLCARRAGIRSAILVGRGERPEWAADATFAVRRLTEVIKLIEQEAA